jgi:hypothetical protein
MQWSTPTRHTKKKTNDWFASLIILAGALIFVSILASNYILATLILSITIALIIAHSSPHVPQEVELRTGGVIVDDTLYPWDNIDAFAIQEYYGIPRLLLHLKRQWAPVISIPISDEVDLDELRDSVEQFVPEKNMHEPILHILAERFGL